MTLGSPHRGNLAKFVPGLVVLLSGCTQLLGKNCTAIEVAAINVTLQDAGTGGPPEVTELTVAARDGEFVDSVRVQGTIDFTVSLAPERPGTYSVEVRSTDYGLWRRSGIEVRLDSEECHVVPARLEALLEPLP